MQSTAIAPEIKESELEPQLALLVADHELSLRVLLAARASDAVEGLTVLEAEDGAHAVQIGLRERPRLALLEVQMPRLGGIEAALMLRRLHPQMPVALYTAERDAHRERARQHRLPLFDKLDTDRTIRWLELQVESLVRKAGRTPRQMLSFECSVCGYGAACRMPPERCPMCQGEATWVHAPRRPFSQTRVFAC